MATKDPAKKRAQAARYYARHREKILAKHAAQAEEKSTRKKARYRENLEDNRAKHRAFHAANREKRNAARRARRLENPEQARSKSRAAYARNPAKHLEGTKRWVLENKEYHDAYHANYRAGHREEARETTAQWQKEHPEQTRKLKRLVAHRRLARLKNLPDLFTLEDEHFMFQYWAYACAACGNQEGFKWTLALDHWIPLASPECPGTVPWNIVPLCHGKGSCNTTKLARNAHEWLVERFGTRKAATIEKKVAAYFALVRTRQEAPPEVA